MYQRGLSLIECLIALILVSVALLGMSGLQLSTLNDSRDSRWRMEALSLTESMLERIRANPDAAEAFAMTAATSTSEISCTSSVLMMCESKKAWLEEMKRILPNPVASIAVDVMDDIKRVRLAVHWRQQLPANGQSLSACNVDMPSSNCVVLETNL